MIDFPQKYKFQEQEKKWQKFWQEQGVYLWDKNESRQNTYVIDTPPPTVSGDPHIGHGFSYVHIDFIARYRRMKGMNVFYPIGVDNNGLPSERLVEKKRKVKASKISRKEFTDMCKDVIDEELDKFRTFFNDLALSVDWNLEYQTISDLSRCISQMSFLDLVKKGEVYRESQPILWDPVDQTALAQADIEEVEKDSFMNNIIFRTQNGDDITIATTRPELLPACVAVFYHPDDKRYRHLEGQKAITPLFGVNVPLLPDDMVKPDKGSGLVMCCTFGDQTDILWWRKHDLPCKVIINKYGKLDNIKFDDDNCNDVSVANQYARELTNLKIKDAREKIIQLLKENKLLIKQTPIKQSVKCAERSGASLEIITTPQWFIKSVKHKEELLKLVKKLGWYPKKMKIKLDNWINGISLDWCISRQRYFGVPFPVWYSKRSGEEGRPIFPSVKQLPVDPLYDLPEGYLKIEVEPDMDVMDTWATSAVSPQIHSRGIADGFMIDEKRHNKLFPADLRPQAHEILRTWAYYAILKSYLHENTLPWKNIMISGWCLAEDKTKMSKSKGNIVQPKTILDEFGADVMRYWAASSGLGVDTAFSRDVMHSGKRLVNKLWNASKFAGNFFDREKILPANIDSLSLKDVGQYVCCNFDKYFLNQLIILTSKVTKAFEEYEYCQAMSLVEEFFWKVLCDNYLEIVKTRIYNEDNQYPEGSKSSAVTLYFGIKTLLQLFAPIVPYITEEIYQILYPTHGSVHIRGNWPNFNDMQFDDSDSQQSEYLIQILEMVRKIKSDDQVSIKAPLKYIEIKGCSEFEKDLIEDLKNVINTKKINFVAKLSTHAKLLQNHGLHIGLEYV